MLTDRLNELLEPIVADLGYELLCLELAGEGRNRCLRIYIDQPEGIGLEDCETVSHEVSAALDVDDPISGNYRLEVSSPGLDRPLTKESHFRQFTGQEARVQMQMPVEGRRRFKGRILGVEDGRLRIEVDGNEVELAMDAIERARLVPDLG